jgi:hypothetical protein
VAGAISILRAMDYDELTTAQVLDSLRTSRECVTRTEVHLIDAKVSLSRTLQRLRESELRIELSDELVQRMLISRCDDPWRDGQRVAGRFR